MGEEILDYIFNDFFFGVIWFVSLLIIGYTVGAILERIHLKSLLQREEELKDIRTFNQKHLPPNSRGPEQPMVSGFVVLSNHYFRNFIAMFRKIIGGRIGVYETLVSRARREAILRLKAEAGEKGATAVYNVRVDTSSISKGLGTVTIEVYAYGTAVK